MPMLLEIEQKFPLDDPQAIRQSLDELGATFSPWIEQVDVYFAHPSRNFTETDEALRIRRVGEQNFVTYKGPKVDPQTKTRREIELALTPGDDGFGPFSELLEALGFRRVFEVRKRRLPGQLTWQGQVVHLALDDVADLGHFLELEQVADESHLEAAKSCLANLAQRLNLTTSERRGYLDLLLSRRS